MKAAIHNGLRYSVQHVKVGKSGGLQQLKRLPRSCSVSLKRKLPVACPQAYLWNTTSQHSRWFSIEVEKRREKEWKEMSNSLLDEIKFPIGSLSVEKFRDAEETARWWIAAKPYQEESVKQSLLLLVRLVKEHESQPELMDTYHMTHWLGGNYPRFTFLLNQALENWFGWWVEKNADAPVFDLNPKDVLSIVMNLSSGSPAAPLHTDIFTILIRATVEGWVTPDAPQFAEELLDLMLEKAKTDPVIQPTVRPFNLTMDGWARSGHPEAIEKVEAMLQHIEKLNGEGIINFTPNNHSYLALMKAWRASDREEAPFRVEELIYTMMNSHHEHVNPDTRSYRHAIHTWVQSDHVESASRAHYLLLQMLQLKMEGNEDTGLDADFFSIVIAKLARVRDCVKAEEVFELNAEMYKKTKDPRLQPNPKAMRAMIIAYSHSRKRGSVRKAERLLAELEGRPNGEDRPKRGHYSDVIVALVGSDEKDAVERAEKTLTKMIHLHKEGILSMLPDAYLFNKVLHAWSEKSGRKAAQRASKLLQVMKDVYQSCGNNSAKPNEQSYHHVMTAWSRTRALEAPEMCEKLLQEMQELSRRDRLMKPTIMHYTALITAWGTIRRKKSALNAERVFMEVLTMAKDGDKSMQPDYGLYCAMIQACARVGDGFRTESAVQLMLEDFLHHGNSNARPTLFCFNEILQAWRRSKSAEGPGRVKSVFARMCELSKEGRLDVAPNGLTFSLLIEIMCENNQVETAEEYLELLKRSNTGRRRQYHLDVFNAYNQIFEAWLKAGNVDRAKCTLEELMKMTKNNKLNPPEYKEYEAFLGRIARSGIGDKAERARRILQAGKVNLIRNGELIP